MKPGTGFLPLLLLAFFLVITGLQAQAPAVEAMPKDPTELMMLAIKRNGLSAPDLKPWHIAATYQTFDDDGKPKEQGTFEMWWAAPDKYKLAFTSPSFTQTEYRTRTGFSFVGNPRWPALPESIVQDDLLNPIPAIASSQKMSDSHVQDGGLPLQCLRIFPEPAPGTSLSPAYCIGTDIPALRVQTSFYLDTAFNDIARLQEQYVARKIVVTKNKLPYLQINVAKLEGLSGIEDSELTPPDGAVQAPAKMAPAPDRVAGGKFLSGDPPQSPGYSGDFRYARAGNPPQIVTVQVTITKEGRTANLSGVSGPKELQEAALQSMKTWRFSPYLLNGEPVEVNRHMDVLFWPKR